MSHSRSLSLGDIQQGAVRLASTEEATAPRASSTGLYPHVPGGRLRIVGLLAWTEPHGARSDRRIRSVGKPFTQGARQLKTRGPRGDLLITC